MDISFLQHYGITIVDQQKSTGLLRVSRPVYRGNRESPEIQLIHLGPGCMNGDTYEQHLAVGESACAVLGYQSYAKVLPGTTGSTLKTTVALGTNSRLTMKPNVVLPYKDSKYASTTQVHLAEGARIMMSDILVNGQDAQRERLAFAQVSLALLVYRDSTLVLRDCLQVGAESLGQGRIWAKGFPVLGSLYLLGDVSRQLEQTLCQIGNEASATDVRVGVTYRENAGFIMRILGKRVQVVERIIEQVFLQGMQSL